MEFSTAEWEGHRIIYGQGPLDSRRPVKLTIGFHGADSTPENMLIHGSRLPLDNAIQIFPQGPVDAGEGLWVFPGRGRRFGDHSSGFSPGCTNRFHLRIFARTARGAFARKTPGADSGYLWDAR